MNASRTFSNRFPPHVELNALSRALAEVRTRGAVIADLTESNPTRVGIPYPDDMLAALADARGLRYQPEPLGLMSAREAVAHDYLRHRVHVDPSRVVLSASTSEAYSWLFKVLCSPGEVVLAPRPSYPLFDHLARWEGVRLASYDLQYHGRWQIDVEALRDAPLDTRAVLLVSPNNPTGAFVSAQDIEQLVTLCSSRGWALVVDEVFADYALEATDAITDLAMDAHVLSCTLGGASKTLGLPQIKVGWMVVGGPDAQRRELLSALELVADTFLSVSTPAQIALPSLLEAGGPVRGHIHTRVRRNLAHAQSIAARFPSCDVLRVEGGWSAVIRVPAVQSEEAIALDLLANERILIHPGYFFDFPNEAFIVVSLLPDEELFADAFERMLRRVA